MDNIKSVNKLGRMKLTGMLYGKEEAGEREGLIGKEGRKDGDGGEREATLRYSKAIHNIKHKFNKKNNNKKDRKYHDNNNNHIKNANYNHDNEFDNKGEEYECKSEPELKVDNGGEDEGDDGLFMSGEHKRPKKKFLSKKKIKKVLGVKSPKKHSFGLKKNMVKSNNNLERKISYKDDDDEDDAENSYSNFNNHEVDSLNEGDLFCEKVNKKKLKKTKKKKVTLSCDNEDGEDDDDGHFSEVKKSKKKKKITKKLAKKVGSKTWSGVKIGWRFFCTGLRSLSAPFNVWDVTGGVAGALRVWRSEVQKREELIARGGR